MGIEVLVVQHGEKAREPGDPGLSDIGHREADTVAAWLAENCPEVGSVWASPLRRAQQTAEPIAASYGLVVQIDARLRERMNWSGEAEITLDGFLVEWQRASDDRSYQPAVGDSSNHAAERFLSSLLDIERSVRDGMVVVISHGGATVDALRTLVGDEAVKAAAPELIDNGVRCCAITRLQVDGGVVTINHYPSTVHLSETTKHRPA